ncbi:MAG: metallophosphoesterase family protein [Candidatus Nezhaarchaeales archaeon]
MKIMVISDLHYDKKVFHGIDESKAWEWLLSIVDYHRPDLLISLGDWGEAINPEEFYELLKRVRVWSIFGNHENLDVLRKMYNILTDTYEPILMGDGEVREFEGLKFGAINGIVALRRRERKGIPRKRPEEFIEYGKRLRDKVDVLLLHDSPWLEEYAGKIARDERTAAVAIAIYEAKPKIVFCGHLHLSPCTIHRFNYGTLYIRIDTSQKHKCYAILNTSSMKVEVWRDLENLTEAL